MIYLFKNRKMSKVPHQQDMPPPGGYKQITYQRIKTWSPKCKYRYK